MTALHTIRELAPIVERVHGAVHPEMIELRALTDALTDAPHNQPDVIADIRTLTNGYTVPEDTCETMEKLYGALKEIDTQ